EVEAGRPKKSTKTPSRRAAFWSIRIPIIRPRRSASRTGRRAPRLAISSTPALRRNFSASASSQGASSGRTTIDRGKPVRRCAGTERQRRIGAREVVEGEPAAAAERHVGGVAEPTTEPEGERQRQPAGGRDEGARG